MTKPPRPRVLLVGNYPPPAGGISIHIERLRDLLRRNSFDVEVLDLYGRQKNADDPPGVFRYGGRPPSNLLRARRHWRLNPPDVIHFHVTYLKAFELAGPWLLRSLPERAKRLMTIHGGGFVGFMASLSPWRRRRLARMLLTFDRVVAVNDSALQTLRDLGIPDAKLSMIPAFLPAAVTPSPQVDRAMDGSEGRIALVCGSGFTYYGFDTFLDAVARIGGQQIRPILALYGRRDEAYVEALHSRIQSMAPRPVLFDDLPPAEFAYLLSKSDIFVRPTDRDGDSVAVREAAQLGKQVVASDCAPRPEGVVLFKTNDVDALTRALSEVLAQPSKGVANADASQYASHILQLYQSFFPWHA